MAQPQPYNRQFNFADQQAQTPSNPLPAQEVDAELNSVKLTLDQTLANLAKIQRDDGALRNGIVTSDSLAPSLSIGFTMRGEWTAPFNYLLNDGVTYENKFYRAKVSHLSVAGETPNEKADLWEEVADFTQLLEDSQAAADAAAASAEAAQAAAQTAAEDAVAASLVEIDGVIDDRVGPNLPGFGAVGDGVTDDTAAIEAAQVAGVSVFVPPGVYDSTIYQGDLRGPLRGSGQVRDSDGNLRAPNFVAIDSEPARGNYGSILETFNGDLSKVHSAVEHRITGAATLGQPVTGFTYTPEASPYFTYLYNESGHNEELGQNIGRTAATAFRTLVTNVGQGDCMAYNFSAFVMGARPGATHFLANPAGSGLAGEVIAGSDGVYLNPMEINCDGGPYDCAGVTLVGNLHRDVATAAKGEIWNGFRVQSNGSAEVDSAFMMTGPHRLGLDLVHGTFNATTKAAIAMKADDRHYWNSTADSRLAKSKPAFGGTYTTYSTAANALVDVVEGVASWQVGPTLNFSTVPIICTPGSVAQTLLLNGMVTFALINNTTLQFSARGADGITRTGNITLA